jgi:AraC-like DNA-binding protein
MSIGLCGNSRRRWSTQDVESRHALAYWVETISKTFLEIDIDCPEREHFYAQLDQFELGPATLCVIEAATQTVRRTRAQIARSRYPAYFLLGLRAGRLRLQQYGRESHLQPGECILVDCKEPYRLDCLDTTRCVAVRFPQDWLRDWLPAAESFANRPFAKKSGWNAALAAALRSLDTDCEGELALPGGMVAQQIAGLLALAAGPTAQAYSPRAKLLHRILGTLRDLSREPGLSPADVAGVHGISKRYLHYLFAQASTTFRTELMRIRLESAHRILNDRRFDNVSVREVAGRCGFVEPSYFARRFRVTFGVGPTQLRAARSRGDP